MTLLTERECGLARAVSSLARCNPFLPERIEIEREMLGRDFVTAGPVWHARVDQGADTPNVTKIKEEVEALTARVRDRMGKRGRGTPEELSLYEDLVLYVLYSQYEDAIYQLITDRRADTPRVGFYSGFLQDLERYLGVPGLVFWVRQEPAHVFAIFFQIRRAFHLIFRNILGSSVPAARLRAAVWQSIFTHDLVRYRRALYTRMEDIPTLIMGPSGTGKELVAQAIGLARYIPFDPARQVFQADFRASFFPLNLSALPSTLIESELFGHRRGAFTGAIEDRAGWLETCPPVGAVFLDEIAEVEVSVQVKLLRVLETRAFQRLGDTRPRRFQGKLIAATNRDMATEIRAGRFREDLYYRLCADLIQTPSLQDRLRDSPQELRGLLLFLAQRIAGEGEAERLADETEKWIVKHLGRDYSWPGNVRELEQCVRNVMIRGEYRAPRQRADTGTSGLVQDVLSGALTADALLRKYCTLVYARTGSYQETARRLGIDRRTVRDRIDPGLLEQLREELHTQQVKE